MKSVGELGVGPIACKRRDEWETPSPTGKALEAPRTSKTQYSTRARTVNVTGEFPVLCFQQHLGINLHYLTSFFSRPSRAPAFIAHGSCLPCSEEEIGGAPKLAQAGFFHPQHQRRSLALRRQQGVALLGRGSQLALFAGEGPAFLEKLNEVGKQSPKFPERRLALGAPLSLRRRSLMNMVAADLFIYLHIKLLRLCQGVNYSSLLFAGEKVRRISHIVRLSAAEAEAHSRCAFPRRRSRGRTSLIRTLRSEVSVNSQMVAVSHIRASGQECGEPAVCCCWAIPSTAAFLASSRR